MKKLIASVSFAIGLGCASAAGAVDARVLNDLSDCQMAVYLDCLRHDPSAGVFCYSEAQAHICYANGSSCSAQ